jgi:hypothetical protein
LLQTWQAATAAKRDQSSRSKASSEPRDDAFGDETILLEMMQVLTKMCQTMRKDPGRRSWQRHANRFRAREMGPAVALRSLGFSRSGQRAPDCKAKLSKFIKTWHAIEKAIGPDAPDTISKWFRKAMAAKSAAKKLPVAPRLNGDYMLSWHLRALLRDRMVAAGVPKLKVNAGATIYQLKNLCPDQCKWLFKVQQYLIQVKQLKGLTVKQFLSEAAEADTPPELLSMWLISCMWEFDVCPLCF